MSESASPERGWLRLRSFAKVNLFLKVLGRRPDGYHELDTVFQTIGLHDTVDLCVKQKIRPGDAGVSIRLPAGGAPTDESNLAWRAADAFRNRWAPGSTIEVVLRKHVPAAAGLGGGSSNAATVLRGLRALVGKPSLAELVPIAKGLGADVPFFLYGGTARARGRGDEIEPLSDLAPATLLVAVPKIHVSTPTVFRSLNAARLRAPVRPLPLPADKDLSNWLLGNDLEKFVLGGYEPVATVYNRLQEIGLESVQLSGTGGALFVVVDGDVDLPSVRQALGPRVKTWLTRTVLRSEGNRSMSHSESEQETRAD